ncbi:MAG: DNA-protecting protein DprA [Elusimicrobia bacterium]|nr:DNA-protecting protein DprA [Elusimicrobiota bacterium]
MAVLEAEEKLARIRINSFSYLKSDWYGRLIGVYGSARSILSARAEDVARDGGISLETAGNLLREAAAADPEKELRMTEALGGRIVALGEDGYPAALAEITEPPLVLYVRGQLPEKPALGVVGTRKPSAYGRRMAQSLSRGLAECGFTIVSGLARGIDSCAHTAVLSAKGVTWAVIGTGLGRCYPAENRKLAEDIVASGGAIVSEFPYERGPMPFHFPRRNRIIAGLSCAVLVVEGAHTSGALITARMAVEQGRDVLALPGQADSPQSEGPNLLIKDGAALVRDIYDIVEALPPRHLFGLDLPRRGKEHPSSSAERLKAELGEDARAVLSCLGSEELSLDLFVERLGWTVPRVSQALFELETQSLVMARDGIYSKN